MLKYYKNYNQIKNIMKLNQFKTFEIEFLHTDGDIRFIGVQAYNEERARMRFHVNWDKEMKIINVRQKT